MKITFFAEILLLWHGFISLSFCCLIYIFITLVWYFFLIFKDLYD